jgi:hypothetical protein
MSELTTTEIVGKAKRTLQEAEYDLRSTPPNRWNERNAYVFEDDYSIVGVVVYETVGKLLDKWTMDQGVLVNLISENVTRSQPKASEGYLVLLTGDVPDPSRERQIEQKITAVRHDTSRLRKLVATGLNLTSTDHVERVLAPLLPLVPGNSENEEKSVLDLLPALLESNFSKDAILSVRKSYYNQDSTIQALHNHINKS